MYLNQLTEALQDADIAVSLAPEWPKVQFTCVIAHFSDLMRFRDTIAKVKFWKNWIVMRKQKSPTNAFVSCTTMTTKLPKILAQTEEVRPCQEDF